MDDRHADAVVRLEWIHARAGNERWKEQLDLVTEELRRLPLYFSHEVEVWGARKRSASLLFTDIQQQQGYEAYANRQAHVYEVLAADSMAFYRRVVK